MALRSVSSSTDTAEVVMKARWFISTTLKHMLYSEYKKP